MEEEDKKLKIVAIASAAKAIRYKEKKPRATENEVIQHINDSLDEIIKNIDLAE